MTKQDKVGQSKIMPDSVSGKRLVIARGLRSLTWQQLASNLTKMAKEAAALNETEKTTEYEIDLKVGTVLKWPKRGIAKKWLFFVAEFFSVAESAFTDENIPERDFKRMISKGALTERDSPTQTVGISSSQREDSLQKSPNVTGDSTLKPVLTLKGKFNIIKGNFFRSPWFTVHGNEAVVITKVWGMIGAAETRVTAVPIIILAAKAIPPPKINGKFLRKKYEGTNADLSQDPDFTSFEIITEVSTTSSDICEKRNVIKQDGIGTYFLMVRSDFNFEINVYNGIDNR